MTNADVTLLLPYFHYQNKTTFLCILVEDKMNKHKHSIHKKVSLFLEVVYVGVPPPMKEKKNFSKGKLECVAELPMTVLPALHFM